jgi:hypothetical protein
MEIENKNWFRNRGYVHLSGQASLGGSSGKNLQKRVQSPDYIKSHAFFPLLHVVIKQRRYKVCPNGKRAHSFWKGAKKESNVKPRPIHYATHVDAMIYSYYAQILRDRYEEFLCTHPELNSAVTAYRSIPTFEDPSKNKSNIHHAKEVFDIISEYSQNEKSIVLAFDIKSFFSEINHKQLYKRYAYMLDLPKLPPDHLNVFKACTRFSYVLKDELRACGFELNVRRNGFDEQRLAKIRNTTGTHSFFFDAKDFRQGLKERKFRIYRNPFKNDKGEMIGIPQGLPISAVLANIYLLEFDKAILEFLRPLGGIYRRYSDDIVIVCREDNQEKIRSYVESQIEVSALRISTEKTEVFHFEKALVNYREVILSGKMVDGKLIQNVPLTYLGFEFYGYQTLIKSANLSKFYRKLIYGVKAKCRMAKKIAERTGIEKPVVFKNQLRRFYNKGNLNDTNVYRKRSFTRFVKLSTGEYRLVSKPLSKKSSTYFSYASRASTIMKEDKIFRQIRNHRKVFNQALSRGLAKKKK